MSRKSKPFGAMTAPYKCPQCGFHSGDEVIMRSALRRTNERGVAIGEAGEVHGFVRFGLATGCGHYVAWEKTGLVTALPNPSVRMKS